MMARIVSTAIVGIAALVLAGSAFAADISGGGTVGATAWFGPTGLERIDTAAPFQFAVSVHDSSGIALWRLSPRSGFPSSISARIDCATVYDVPGVARQAFMGGTIVASSYPAVPPPAFFNVGARVMFYVFDLGGGLTSFVWSPGDEHPGECGEPPFLWPSGENWGIGFPIVTAGQITIG
jgi:hypothetical protein